MEDHHRSFPNGKQPWISIAVSLLQGTNMYKQVLHHLCQPFFLAILRKFEGIHPFLSAYPSRSPSGYPTVIKHGLLDLSTIGRSLIPWKITVKIHHWLSQLQTSTPKGRRFPSHVWWTFSPVSTQFLQQPVPGSRDLQLRGVESEARHAPAVGGGRAL